MKTINAFDPTTLGSLPERQQALIRRREALLGPAYRLFYQDPVELVRGQGVWVWDAEGKRYLDAYNNVVSLGHCHPHVVQALQQQSAQLNTHTRYLNEALLDYAERLLATHHPSLDRLMFTCTGSEANDLALRLALTRPSPACRPTAYGRRRCCLIHSLPAMAFLASPLAFCKPPWPAPGLRACW